MFFFPLTFKLITSWTLCLETINTLNTQSIFINRYIYFIFFLHLGNTSAFPPHQTKPIHPETCTPWPTKAAFHRYRSLYLAQPSGHVAHCGHRHMTSLPLCRADLPFNSNTNPGAGSSWRPAAVTWLAGLDTRKEKEGRSRAEQGPATAGVSGCGRDEQVSRRPRLSRCCCDRWDLTVSGVCVFSPSLTLSFLFVARCLLSAKNAERAHRNRKFELW